MSKPQYPYRSYRTNKTEPACVKYWERHFVAQRFWIDWVVFKTSIYAHIGSIKSFLRQENYNATTREAKNIIWDAVIAAYEGAQKRSPITPTYHRFVDTIEDSEMMLFLAHLQIGCFIHQGLSEAKARREYIAWLQEDPRNPVWENYALTTDFQIISLDEYQMRQKTRAYFTRENPKNRSSRISK